MIHDHSAFAAPRSAAASAYGDAAAERVRRFLPMVRRLAWHFHGGGRPGIEMEDLIQAGLVALTECAQRHTGPGEDGFAAYAKMRVRGAMVDLVRRAVPLARGTADRRRALRRREAELAAELGRAPTGDELATSLSLSLPELAAIRDGGDGVRLESLETAYSDSDMAYADDAPDAFSLLENAQLRGQLAQAIADLPQRLQMVVQLYFVEELNLTEIAAVLDVSVPRVHQLKAQALEKLRTGLDGVAEIL